MKKLLLHICCGPCATAVYEKLKYDYDVIGYYYNPNIQPDKEFDLRLASVKKLAGQVGMKVIIERGDEKKWFDLIKGLEKESEGGKRCKICMKTRLNKTVNYAIKNGFDYFASTLSISPYKDTIKINRIGKELGEKSGVKFLKEDFSKEFQESVVLSKKMNLYRQKYCGCIYSKN